MTADSRTAVDVGIAPDILYRAVCYSLIELGLQTVMLGALCGVGCDGAYEEERLPL
jgi:hypothetical protein